MIKCNRYRVTINCSTLLNIFIGSINKCSRFFFIKNWAFIVKERHIRFCSKYCASLATTLPIFLAAYGYLVGRTFHLLKVSTNRPHFWYLDMMWSVAQTGHVPSIETSSNQKEQYLVNTAGGIKLLNWVFPNRFRPAPQHVDEHYHAEE